MHLIQALSMQGRIGRRNFAAVAWPVFLAPHALVVLAHAALGEPLVTDATFWFAPWRRLAGLDLPVVVSTVALALVLAQSWVVVALALRRAADAQVPGWLALGALAPLAQWPFMVGLSLAPGSAVSPELDDSAVQVDWRPAAQGLLVAVGLTVGAVAVGALIFRSYGWGLFVFTPFLVGLCTGYLANRRRDLGEAATFKLVFGATLFGGAALIATALEGLICLVMAAPLAILPAAVGGQLGRGEALHRLRKQAGTLMSIAVLPVLFALEQALPPQVPFETRQDVVIEAQPEAVWRAIVTMTPLEPEPPLLFRLGVGYPMAAELHGEGVGARRLGVFSTGIAEERVTAWEPGRLFAYEVLTQPPAMRELSPYEHVHAPHAVGYFRTRETLFQLVPLPDGRTRLVETSRHELRLDPVFYWLPMARWVVAQNNARVLAHIKAQAER